MAIPRTLTAICIQIASEILTSTTWAPYREEDADTEDFERLLAALDERPEYRPFEAPPVTRQEPGAGCAEVAAVEPA